ncbi:hypothetical protein BHM03_00037073 [Ensete ventricosum]|uniref:Uncharacterized protein n=1 Tax=Ensete ventricosum TaxID=4639 RepID=A0A445MJM0_ENSVE|nr:hypothetical protein BHM03_00037073 [Ensete ventricosum]
MLSHPGRRSFVFLYSVGLKRISNSLLNFLHVWNSIYYRGRIKGFGDRGLGLEGWLRIAVLTRPRRLAKGEIELKMSNGARVVVVAIWEVTLLVELSMH